MNTLRGMPFLAILLALLNVQQCIGQAIAELIPGPENSTLPKSPVNSLVLQVCNDEDNLSKAHCKCSDRVVSCDFSHYTGLTDTTTTTVNKTNSEKATKSSSNLLDHIELDLHGSRFPANTSRVCICNTPPNIHLNFSRGQFLPWNTNRIQRFDLFNLTGVTHFMGGFSENFQGDLYIANVSRIAQIHEFEFGRRNDDNDPIQNVQDLLCCSPIKSNQNYEKPVFFLENSTVDFISSHGLNDNHIWKTLIMKFVKINMIEENGISFHSSSEKGYNVAILRSSFRNVANAGVIFEGAANVFLAKNSFKHSNNVSAHFFGSISTLLDSNVLLLDNTLWNEIVLELDARHIFSWYNVFDIWDNYTFNFMKYSELTASFQPDQTSTVYDRSISFKNNIVATVELPKNSIDLGNGSLATFTDNILGTCNCSLFMIMDEKVKPELSWCNTGKVSRMNGKCSIRLDAAFQACNKSSLVDFEKMCDDKTISGYPAVGANLTEDIEKMHINSAFIPRIVRNLFAFAYYFLNKWMVIFN